jgi:hypothetical protein
MSNSLEYFEIDLPKDSKALALIQTHLLVDLVNFGSVKSF